MTGGDILNRIQYIDKHIASYNLAAGAKQAYVAVWNAVSKAEGKVGKVLEQSYTHDEYLELFKALGHGAYATIGKTKVVVGGYLKSLVVRGVLDDSNVKDFYSLKFEDMDISVDLASKYFKDFGTLQRAIDRALGNALRLDDGAYATQISAVYLAWSGLKACEAIRLKKSEVLEDRILIGNREIRPSQKVMSFLTAYRDAIGYESRAANIITLKYAPSDHLLRTVRSDSISASNIRIYINRMGKHATENSINLFNYDKVYWSGIFNRAYMHELANGSLRSSEKERLQLVFNESFKSNQLANRRLREYLRFKKFFYPEPVAIYSK
jgi:hypothetical protein